MRWIFRGLLALLLAGCSTAPAPAPVPALQGPGYFGAHNQSDVVLGYFTEPKHLGIATCPDDDPDLGIDCFGPFPKVTLVVQDVIFGSVDSARLELSIYDVEDPNRFPIGPRQRVIAYPESWGNLGTYAWQRIFRTRSGDWAIPVAARIDLPALPCDAGELLEPHVLDVARSLPARPLAYYDEEEVAEIEANEHASIRGGKAYSRAGVLLSEIYDLRERIPRLEGEHAIQVDACLRRRAKGE